MRKRLQVIMTGLSLFAFPAQGRGLVAIPAGEVKPFLSDVNAVAGKSTSLSNKVNSFHIMDAPVTNEDFLLFLASHPEWQRVNASQLFVDQGYLKHLDPASNQRAKAQAPVTNVSWFAARAYCQAQGMRLPTTDEWEYVAAASETARDATTDPAFLAWILEWYGKPDEGSLPSVRSTFRNVYGVYDLHGLIWEWSEDFNAEIPRDEDGIKDRDLFCGGGSAVARNKENYAAFMRFAFRASLSGRFTAWHLGFRCAQ